jgi:predicted regulator of Ras-like GTPase activity (Roadblock/LC7/MglB family)
MRTDNLDDLLSDVLTVRGVVAVAVVDEGGAVKAEAASESPGFADAGPLIAASLAASRVLGGFLGGGLRHTVIEFRGGPVLLAPVPRSPGSTDPGDTGMVLAMRLAGLGDLGRVRFQLPRLLAQFAATTT